MCSLIRFAQHLFVNHTYFISIMIGGTFSNYVTFSHRKIASSLL